MPAKANIRDHASVPDWPYPSALALVACRARIGVLDALEMGVLFGRWGRSPERSRYLGWESLCSPQRLPLILRSCRLRPEQLRLSCRLGAWCPPAVKDCYAGDVTPRSRLRYCRLCLERGFHTPLFQLPWWNGCPIHRDEPLREACRCGALLPAGLDLDAARILICDACGADLIHPGRMLGLADSECEAGARDTWQAVVFDYRRWMAEVSTQFMMPLRMIVDDFGDSSILAAELLARANARLIIPATLQYHLDCSRAPRATAFGQMRDFAASNKPRLPQPLNFKTRAALVKACRRFYRALPITDRCFRGLLGASRHLRRRLRIRLIGDGPCAASGFITYDWNGKGTHPHEIGAFRLMGSLMRVERINGQPYLDFADEDFFTEPAQRLAREVLARWSGVRLPVKDDEDKPHLIEESFGEALKWLYEQCIVAAWADTRAECFDQARAGGVAGHVKDALMIYGQLIHVTAPIRIPPIEDPRVNSRPTPNRDHAYAIRTLPRGWACSVVHSIDRTGNEVYATVFGRTQRLALDTRRSRGIRTKWPLPDALRHPVREGKLPVY